MTDELSDEARALIQRAVGQERPAGDLRRRAVKEALLARAAALGGQAAAASVAAPPLHGAGGALPSAGAALPGAGSATLPGAGALAALLAKGAALGLVVAGTIHGAQRWSPARAAGSALGGAHAQVSTVAAAPRPAPVAHAVSAGAPDLAPTETSGGAARNDAAPALASRSAAPGGRSDADAAPNGARSLRSELELMGAVQAALRDGRPALALQLIDRHALVYPHGQLEAERLAAEAVAACQSGDEAGGQRAARAFFLMRDPGSPLAERVRRACPEPPTDRLQ